MSDITLSAGVRQNLLSLQNTASLMASTQNRLATGKKVNSALDNPISYFTSQSLNNRANDLNNLLDSISNATQTIQAANNGITSLTKLVQSAQAITQQALQAAGPTAAVDTGSVASLTGASSFVVTSLKTITVSDGSTTATIAAGATNLSVQDVIDGVNNTSGIKISASLDSTGHLQLKGTDSATTITVGGTASTAEKVQFGLADGATAPTASADRTSLAAQFDALRTQIDQLAGDSGYSGVNLLGGDNLKVTFNETGTSSQSVNGVTFDSAGLGIAASTNNFQSNTDVNTAISNLATALGTLRSQAANFGGSLSVVQTRQDFTKNTINTLQTGADNLVLADTNQEGANLLALQTRQSLSTTALSLSAQSDQAVLRLFG